MADRGEINLLPFEERAQERFELLQKRLSVASVVFLVTTAIFTVATLVFFSSLASRRSRLIGEVEKSSNTINSYKTTEELIVVVKNKTSAADKILVSRTDYTSTFEKLSGLVPQGVYFNDVKITSGKIAISGKAKTSADVAGLVSALLSSQGAQVISSVSVESLSSDEKGIYSFVISGQLKT